MTQDTEFTIVIFRTFKSGEVIALFPEERLHLDLCKSYMHVGQHDSAEYNQVMSRTKPSCPEEIAPLKREIESLGYLLKIRKRWHKQ